MARALAVMGVAALLFTSCSSGSDDETVTSTTTTPAETTTPPTTATTTTAPPTTQPFDGPPECRPVADLRDVALGTDAALQEDLDRVIEAYVALGLDSTDPHVSSLDEMVTLIEEVGPGATNTELARAVLTIAVGAIDRTSRALVPADRVPDGCGVEDVFDDPMMRARAVEAGFDTEFAADWGPGQEAAVFRLSRDFDDGLGCPVLDAATGSRHETSDWNVDIGVFRWAWNCVAIDGDSPTVAIVGVSDPASLVAAGTTAAVTDDGTVRIVRRDRVDFDPAAVRAAFMTEGSGSAAVTYDPGRGRGLAVISMDGSDPVDVLQKIIGAWS